MKNFIVHKITKDDKRTIAYQFIAESPDKIIDWLKEKNLQSPKPQEGICGGISDRGIHMMKWIEFENGDYYRLVPVPRLSKKTEIITLE